MRSWGEEVNAETKFSWECFCAEIILTIMHANVLQNVLLVN